MRATMVLATLLFVLPCTTFAQDSPSQGVKFEFGATLNSILSDTVDARKCKPGDTVKARASEDVKVGGVVVIPRGAKLVGHVTEARPAAKSGEQARLGLVFERAELKDGRQVPLHTVFYALAAPEGANSEQGSSFGGFGSGGSDAVGNMISSSSRNSSDDGSTVGDGSPSPEQLKPSPGAIGGLNGKGALYASSRGVFGFDGISLESNTVPSQGSSVILADARSVHLPSGTRMLLSLDAAGKP